MPAQDRPLPTPRELRAALPLGPRARVATLRAREEIRAALRGRDPRRLAIVGPCSLHDRAAALEYAARLAELAHETRDHLLVVMRAYFQKPRTTLGWKGLIHDPHLDGSGDVAAGLERARGLLVEITELGLPCASELLDPMTRHYLADALCWVAIGARTAESQIHREMASELDLPVGFKNGTGGNVEIARDAALAAAQPQTYPGIDAEGRFARVRSPGNPDGHLILRGGRDRPNYFPEDVDRAAKLLPELARPVIVDCSHDNSRKLPGTQIGIAAAVFDDDHPGLLGVMLESHLHEGRQDWQPGGENRYGVSITDPCLGWADTARLLRELARPRRTRAVA